MHDAPVLSLAKTDRQMLEKLVVQCIGCCGKLRWSCHCVSNVRTTKHTGKENLSKDAPVSKTLFSLGSFVFWSILDQTCYQIEQIGNVALVQWRLRFVRRLARRRIVPPMCFQQTLDAGFSRQLDAVTSLWNNATIEGVN